MVTCKYPKNKTIILEGDQVDTIFYIRSGIIKLIQSYQDGKVQILNILGKSDYFGEVPAFDQIPSPYSAITMVPSEISFVSVANFEDWRIIPDLCIKLRDSWIHLALLRTLNTEERVYRTILLLISKFGIEDGDNILLSYKFTIEDLAFYIGLSRETVNKIIIQLLDSGKIKKQGKMYSINRSFLPLKMTKNEPFSLLKSITI